MNIHTLKLDGFSIRKIADITGISRNAVRRALRSATPPAGKRRRVRYEKLVVFEAQIHAWLTDPVRKEWTAARIFDELVQRGYSGGDTVVKRFVRENRPALPKIAEARFHVKPGQQIQVDWGEMILPSIEGKTRKVYVFVAVMAWSRQMFIRFTESMDILQWLDCHMRAFQFFGGVTNEVLIDNLKTGVESRAGGTIRWNEAYAQLAVRLGFRPIAHVPRRPKTKGRVERMVRFVRERFFIGHDWSDIEQLNIEASEWLNERANKRIHRITRQRPNDRFATERLALKPFEFFDPFVEETRVSDAYALVAIHGTRYSVPATFARRHVTVQRSCANIRIYCDHALIAEHAVARKGVRLVQRSEHLPPKPKPQHDRFSELGSDIIKLFGDVGARYVAEVEKRAPHAPLALLREVTKTSTQFSLSVVRRSLETLLEYQVVKRGKLESLCYRFGEIPRVVGSIVPLEHFATVEQRALAVYDEVHS